MNIGNKIKELRKQKGITQEHLADSIGISFQAVSKWENNIALPDITLAPILASYFGVSMDELFDYDSEKIQDHALAIAKESWKYRETNWEMARNIIDEGLKRYPDNDILLLNRLYVMNCEETPDEVIEIASKIIDFSKDEANKYDACRFLACAYKSKHDIESTRKAIELIPDIRFSNLSMRAELLEGKEKYTAACDEYLEALYYLMHSINIISDCNIKNGEYSLAKDTLEDGLRVIAALNVKNDWYGFGEKFSEKLSKLKNKV